MGCIYNGVCSALVALFSWQQVTNLAAVMADCGISPSRYGSFSKLDLSVCLSSALSLLDCPSKVVSKVIVLLKVSQIHFTPLSGGFSLP